MVRVKGARSVAAAARSELDDFVVEQSRNPEFRAAYEDAEAREALLGSLVARRQRLGLSQAQIAGRMATTQSAVSDFERGATDPRLTTLQRYARAVGCGLVVALREDTGSA